MHELGIIIHISKTLNEIDSMGQKTSSRRK